jgi:flavin-dependent dehydrogenase
LKDYDALWKKEFASEIRIGLKVKNIYTQMPSKDLKQIFKLFKKHHGVIERIGDFENHSRLILELIKKPALYPEIGYFFQVIFRNLLQSP